MPKTRNIIIFIAIAAVLILVYVFLVRPFFSNPSGLVSLPTTSTSPTSTDNSGSGSNATNSAPVVPQDFLTLLLNVKNIKLDDTIFSNPAFASLHDSSIVLTPDAVIGRPNPFAQLGTDANSSTPPPATTPGTGTVSPIIPKPAQH